MELVFIKSILSCNETTRMIYYRRSREINQDRMCMTKNIIYRTFMARIPENEKIEMYVNATYYNQAINLHLPENANFDVSISDESGIGGSCKYLKYFYIYKAYQLENVLYLSIVSNCVSLKNTKYQILS